MKVLVRLNAESSSRPLTPFLSLWDITSKLGGRLYLVNYEDSREQFKVIQVLDLDERGILLVR